MPDEILVSIVFRLPLKEAAATSLIPGRWWYVGVSTITLPSTLMGIDAIKFSNENNLHQFWHQPKEFKEQVSWKYVNWVNRVMQQHRGQHIEQFRASFFVDSRISGYIDDWIQLAM